MCPRGAPRFSAVFADAGGLALEPLGSARHAQGAGGRPLRVSATSGLTPLPAWKAALLHTNTCARRPGLVSRKFLGRRSIRRRRQSRRRTYETSIPPWCSRKRFRNPSSNGFGSQSNSGRLDKALRTLRMRHRNLSLLRRAMSVAAWISLIPRSKDGSSPFVAFTSIRHPMPPWLNRKSKPYPSLVSFGSPSTSGRTFRRVSETHALARTARPPNSLRR